MTWPPWRTNWGMPSTPCWPPPQPLHLPFLPAAGRDRLHLRRDDAGGPPAGRGKRRGRAPRPALPPGGRCLCHHPCARPSSPCSSARRTRWCSRTPRWTNLLRPTWRTCKTQFGDAVEVSDEFRWEWVSIPHIYHPFYVYAYAFGQLLVLSLYQQYKAEGEAFKPRYLQDPVRGRIGGAGQDAAPRPASTSARQPSGRAASMCIGGTGRPAGKRMIR